MNKLTEKQAIHLARKVYPIFAANGWTWGEEDYPPSVERLAKTIAGLHEDVRCDRKCTFAQSGRITWMRGSLGVEFLVNVSCEYELEELTDDHP